MAEYCIELYVRCCRVSDKQARVAVHEHILIAARVALDEHIPLLHHHHKAIVVKLMDKRNNLLVRLARKVDFYLDLIDLRAVLCG